MGRIHTYQTTQIPDGDDILVGTDVQDANKTKNFKISDVLNLVTLSSLSQNTTNTSNMYVGDLFLYNVHAPSGNGYVKLQGDKNRFNVWNNDNKFICSINHNSISLGISALSQNTISITSLATANRVYTFPDATGTVALKTAASGTFTSQDGKTVTVVDGLITSIV